ncbi:ribosome-associated translation inhibitor RaiA [Actinospica sp. MGRD01-02]|uniref:Ribosome hibernation promoting factor n=1 Tax=Actinospica acidithermotolerans TaxID=2828514 RepID=A0A941EE64_9ACTN|nr:ribosome-associated translation inhibitor RaiA [Actinospica acidithermotolerans]MBR7827409.1 ribosome-associated translation inhibitor RaiA [Actinospica acidithermotolerans]
MEIVVKGRKAEVTERFRKHVVDKLTRIERYDHKIISLDVELSKERNPRQTERKDRVELTMRSRGPVIRAEACAQDPYAALDLAVGKLEARMRRAADRRRVHHGRRSPVSVAVATSNLAELEAADYLAREAAEAEGGAGKQEAQRHKVCNIDVEGDGPLVVREKTHAAKPMALDQALYEMELVGHDFYLFVDADTKLPSVVYRRRGYDYGVIRLDDAAHFAEDYDAAHFGGRAA